MKFHKLKLLTIVTERALEAKLTKAILQQGAKGYTISDARGKGSQGVRNSDWDASANIKIEILCKEEVAQAISIHMKEYYSDDYAMVLYLSDVDVLRESKFLEGK